MRPTKKEFQVINFSGQPPVNGKVVYESAVPVFNSKADIQVINEWLSEVLVDISSHIEAGVPIVLPVNSQLAAILVFAILGNNGAAKFVYAVDLKEQVTKDGKPRAAKEYVEYDLNQAKMLGAKIRRSHK